jgi:hypothetical protein
MQHDYLLFEHRAGGIDDRLVPDHFLPRSELGGDVFKLELSVGTGSDPDAACFAEFKERHGYRTNVEEGHLIHVGGTHLPALAALVAQQCGRSPTADHHDTLLTCLQTLVDRGVLGPQLGFGGNDRAIRSWLDQAGIPYHRTESNWTEGMTAPEMRAVPN